MKIEIGQVWRNTSEPAWTFVVVEMLTTLARIQYHGEDASYWVKMDRFHGRPGGYEFVGSHRLLAAA